MSTDKREKIEKWSARYFLLYHYARPLFRLFYKKVHVIGKENIPKNQPVIFAPNHQNALMDALAVLFTQPKSVVFLARADIFAKKRTRDFLNLIKILPIYRMRDGVSNLQKNDEIFDHTIRVLRKKIPICIMPEGSHGDKYRIRPFVKGIFRIAFSTQEVLKNDDNCNVKIVPVGLNYDDYIKFNHPLLVIYGKPIDTTHYLKDYEENAPKTINELRLVLKEKLSELVIDIQDEEYYQLINDIRNIYYKKMIGKLKLGKINFYHKFIADKKTIDILNRQKEKDPEWFKTMDEKMQDYKQKLKQLNMRNWVLESPSYSYLSISLDIVLLIITSPVFLHGFLNNILPYYFPNRFVRKVKDKQFHSSFKWVLAIILFPVFYITAFVIFSVVMKNIWYGLLYLISLPISGFIAYKLHVMYKKTIAKWRYINMLKTNNKDMHSLIENRDDILSTLDNLINQYLKDEI